MEFKQQISSRSDPFGLDTILSGAQLEYFEKECTDNHLYLYRGEEAIDNMFLQNLISLCKLLN